MTTRAVRVLFAEDVDILREAWQRVFERRPYYEEITFVSDGQEAIEAVIKHPYDIAVLDVNMPRVDGVEALRAIKSTQPSIKAFFLSGTIGSGVARELSDKTGVPVVVKGDAALSREELINVIDCILEDRFEDLPFSVIQPLILT